MLLNEAGVVFGNTAYPKGGNILILAGGAGSGKDFIKDNFILFDGKVLDVDKLKTETLDLTDKKFKFKHTMNLKYQNFLKDVYNKNFKVDKRLKNFIDDYYDELFEDGIEGLDLKNPMETFTLHTFLNDFLKFDTKQKNYFYGAISPNKRDEDKPNVIFNVTLKNIKALKKIHNFAVSKGYDKKNIHLVWVLNDVDVASKNNLKRSRRVANDILIKTHKGASLTIRAFLKYCKLVGINDYLDGDIYVIPNKSSDKKVFKQEKIDKIVRGDNAVDFIKDKDDYKIKDENGDNDLKPTKIKRDENGEIISGYHHLYAFTKYHIKKRGKPIKTFDELDREYSLDSDETNDYHRMMLRKRNINLHRNAKSDISSYTRSDRWLKQ